MNRFVSSEEPGGTHRPAPPSDQPPTLRSVARGTVGWLKGISGLDAYERYLKHERGAHPGSTPLSEAEFWRCRWESDEKNPKSRCC